MMILGVLTTTACARCHKDHDFQGKNHDFQGKNHDFQGKDHHFYTKTHGRIEACSMSGFVRKMLQFFRLQNASILVPVLVAAIHQFGVKCISFSTKQKYL